MIIMKYDIFISYRKRCSGDKPELLQLMIEEMGYRGRVSFDKENLDGKFNVSLINRIDNCRDYLMFIAPETFASVNPSDDEQTSFYLRLAEMPENECVALIDELDRSGNANFDYVRIELSRILARARRGERVNIIPIVPEDSERFRFCDLNLPADLKGIKDYQAIFYSNSVVSRLKQIRPDLKKHLKSRPKSSRALFYGAIAAIAIIGCAVVGHMYSSQRKAFESAESFAAVDSLSQESHLIGFFDSEIAAKKAVFDSLRTDVPSLNRPMNWSDEATIEQITAIRGIIEGMVPVEGGIFMLGATRSSDNVDPDIEFPASEQTVLPFRIQKFETTKGQWAAIMGTEVPEDSTEFPVTNVSFLQCAEFVGKLSDLSGLTFALPTESEWEYAAKEGGRTDYLEFSGSDTPETVAWYEANSSGRLHANNDFSADLRWNRLDLYHLSGNAAEWCDTEFLTYEGESFGDSLMVVRGGSFDSPVYDITVTHRTFLPADEALANVGLRLVLRN